MAVESMVSDVGGQMNKELAEKILKLTLQEMEINNDKWAIRRELELNSWEDVKTEAMKFMSENK